MWSVLVSRHLETIFSLSWSRLGLGIHCLGLGLALNVWSATSQLVTWSSRQMVMSSLGQLVTGQLVTGATFHSHFVTNEHCTEIRVGQMRWWRLILLTFLRIVLINTGLTKKFFYDFKSDLTGTGDLLICI